MLKMIVWVMVVLFQVHVLSKSKINIYFNNDLIIVENFYKSNYALQLHWEE